MNPVGPEHKGGLRGRAAGSQSFVPWDFEFAIDPGQRPPRAHEFRFQSRANQEVGACFGRHSSHLRSPPSLPPHSPRRKHRPGMGVGTVVAGGTGIAGDTSIPEDIPTREIFPTQDVIPSSQTKPIEDKTSTIGAALGARKMALEQPTKVESRTREIRPSGSIGGRRETSAMVAMCTRPVIERTGNRNLSPTAGRARFLSQSAVWCSLARSPRRTGSGTETLPRHVAQR